MNAQVEETVNDDNEVVVDEEIDLESEAQKLPEENPAEERALKMGWVPEDQFKGDPNRWRPAEEFVERGEMMIPILNKKIRNLEKRQSEKDKAFSDYLGDIRSKLHSQKVDEHEGRKRKAVADGDTDEYTRLSNDPPKNDIPEYKPPEQTNDPAFDDWLLENSWYQTDYDKHQEAESYGKFLRGTRPELEGKDFLDEVSKHVRQKYTNPNRDKPSSVDGGTQKAKVASGKLYDTLDAEAKSAFSSFVRDGIFKNSVEDREAYAKDVLG